MNIVFDYRPSEPRTTLTVNGSPHSDRYDELGAVCGYPIQSWLYPRGSWKGLRRTLNDLARGREMRIEFIGRKADFEDFRAALEGMENAALSFRRAYENEEIADASLSEVRGLIGSYPAGEIRERFDALMQGAPTGEHIWIGSAEDYAAHREALANGRTLAVFSAETYRQAAADLRRLLRENFMRPIETILVQAKDSREREALLEETAGIGVTVTLDPEADRARLFRKYGEPESAGAARKLYTELAGELDNLVLRVKALKRENRRIQREQRQAQEDGLHGSEEDERAFDANAREIKWMAEHHGALDELADQLRMK